MKRKLNFKRDLNKAWNKCVDNNIFVENQYTEKNHRKRLCMNSLSKNL